ncbi:MAG: lysophospholipid acyltransferase family protein [Ignavibacteriaceae bacterium]
MLSYLKLFFIIIHTIICSIFALLFSLDRTHSLYVWLSKIFSGGILLIAGIKLKVTGLENIDKKAVYIFASNHASQFDIPALQYAIPNRMSIVFKKELAKIPIFGWQLKTGPYIMIDRKNAEKALKSIEEAKRKMMENRLSATIFPEGTRSLTGEVQAFKRGAFNLASKVGYPVVPVTISGSDKLLPKGKFIIKSGTIHVHFDKPVPTDNIKTRADELALMEKVRDIIIRNLETHSGRTGTAQEGVSL